MEHVQQTPLSGDLAQYMLPEIFLKAVLQQFSGILEIESNQLKKIIYFKNGNVVFVESNDREEIFGHYLIKKNLIDPKTLAEALEELSNQKDLKLGEILLKRGVMDPNSLMTQLNLHQEEKLLNAFLIKKGNYNFVTESEWPVYVTSFPIRTLNVFFSAIEKHFTLDEIEDYAYLCPKASVQLKHQPSRDLLLPPFATRLLNTLNRNVIVVDELAKKISVPIEKVILYLFVFKLSNWISVDKLVVKNVEELNKKKEKLPQESQNINEEIVEKKEASPAFLQRMEIDHKNLEKQNFYQIFSLGAEFTEQQIQVKFFQVVSDYKKYEAYNLGKEMVGWVKTAYEVLRDPKLRSIYDRRFPFRKKTENSERAEKFFYKALKYIEKDDFENAGKILDEINILVSDSTFRAYKAWVLFKQNPQMNLTDVISLMEQAFQIYPADPFAHYIEGQIMVFRKNTKKAAEHFRSALQVYPSYAAASVALADLKIEKTKEKRAEEDSKKTEKPGFFDLSVGGFSFSKKD